jgi:DNA polymerase III alpha subunit
LCGCISSTGIHAGGVIISNKPINENAAILEGGDTAVLPLIQFEMNDLDFFGFLNTMGNVNAGYMRGLAKAL